MRDPKRLDSFYDDMKDLHKKYIPDWRFGQFMSNFLGWVYTKSGKDPFFIEEDELLKEAKEFIFESVGGWKHGISDNT